MCIGHRAFHLLFNSTPRHAVPYVEGTEPAIGTLGETVTLAAKFDGWGYYVHLYDRQTLAELDMYAIDEGHEEEFALGFGDLTVHEVATDPHHPGRAYLAYYSGGIRAIDIVDGEIVEVGGYLEPKGNDFSGELRRDGKTYILASDRDSGLWVFRRS